MNETLDRQTFINAMQQMFRRLDAQDELIARLLEGRETAGSGIGPTLDGERLYDTEDPTLDGERLYDTEDLCLMLHVSKRTIQRYRLLGVLPYVQLRKKAYFKESDISRFLRRQVPGISENEIGEYFARIVKPNK
ncbi:MAG: hypothetical protein AUK63_2589 [bacterium P3]|nr:MAG: hypothetical protein AUK63_2589 [bacterium P3]